MNVKANVIAQRLLNLYRQEHVIFGGWSAVNKVFIEEATPEVLEELQSMPTGKNLIKHIENLRTGKTSMNTIERELLPYGGMMSEGVATTTLTKSEWQELETGLNNFMPNQDGLKMIQDLQVVKKFGDEWIVGIRSALAERQDLLEKWALVSKTYRAYYLWRVANEILEQPLSERSRAQLQADMPEYETYLPMFGQAGEDLLVKLRTFLSAIKPFEENGQEL